MAVKRNPDVFNRLLVFIDQVISHPAADPPVFCQILREPQPNGIHWPLGPIRKLKPQRVLQPFWPLDISISERLHDGNQGPFGLIELLDLNILSGYIKQIERKIVKGWSVIPRSPKRSFYLQRYLEWSRHRIMPYYRTQALQIESTIIL